jgi:hypothetical protein
VGLALIVSALQRFLNIWFVLSPKGRPIKK